MRCVVENRHFWPPFFYIFILPLTRYEIANGFDKKSRQMKYTNSLAEEKNNELKTIIKNAYGYNNFARFRKRAMMIMTYKNKKR